MKLAIALTVWSSVAAAEGTPPLCVPPSPKPALFAVGGKPVVCWAETGDCVDVPDGKVVPHPPLAKHDPELRDVKGKRMACAGSSCRAIGTRLATDTAAHPDWVVQLTRDLAIAAISDPASADHRLWNIAKDKPIKITYPAEYKKSKGDDPPTLVGADIVGNTIFTSWIDCAGPCAMAVLVDPATGKNRGAWFPTGRAIELDDHRIAVIGNEADGKLTVIDTRTAAQTAVVLADEAIEASRVVKLAANELGVLWSDKSTFTAARVKLGPTPVITDPQTFTACP